MKIAVAGLGYVGLANSVMFSKKYSVSAFDIDENKILKTNEKFRINATTDGEEACRDADFVIVATPTDFVENKKCFDTSSVEDAVHCAINANPGICVVIKSTVPVGFTKKLIDRTGHRSIIFSPEFLREGREFEDCFNPSRIVIGAENISLSEKFRDVVLDCAEKGAPVLLTGTGEAEAIKLFSNTYLAMRVAFFNELDTFSEEYGFETKKIIDGICMDPRIGDYYNNPSFGYGGYCLPKDTKQLVSDFGSIPQSMFSSVVESNKKRMEHITERILRKNPDVVGIYRLVMKSGSDNFRFSSVLEIMGMLNKNGVKTVIYEPELNDENFGESEVLRDLEKFGKVSDVIIANRYSDELCDVSEKVYTRDLFFRD